MHPYPGSPSEAHGLTKDEWTAIGKYCGSGYGRINAYLRASRKPPKANVDQEIANIESGLLKLRKAQQPSAYSVVHRGVGPDAMQFIEGIWILNGEIDELALMSTSTLKRTGLANANNAIMITVLSHLTGADVSMISGVDAEQEVLFPSGTKWQVTEVRAPSCWRSLQSQKYVHRYFLKELPSFRSSTYG